MAGEEVVDRGTARVVVELNPDEIEGGIRDGVAELVIGDRALGSSRKVEPPRRHLLETIAQTIGHDGVT